MIHSILLLRSTCIRLSESFYKEPHPSQQNLLQCSELLKTSKMGQLYLQTNQKFPPKNNCVEKL